MKIRNYFEFRPEKDDEHESPPIPEEVYQARLRTIMPGDCERQECNYLFEQEPGC